MGIKKILIRGFLTGIVAIIVMVAFGWAGLIGLDREASRMDAVRQYNCTHYWAVINKHYGQELCPPTPQG